MENALALGRLIRESRLKKGLSLGQLAAEVGRSSSSVRRWERGEVPPARSVMGDLAAALDLDPEDLEALRPHPADPTPSAAPDDDVIDHRPSTVEQPVVEAVDDKAQPPVVESVGFGAVDAPRTSGLVGDVIASLRSMTKGWDGWIRGLLTLGVLLVMIVILIWALGELFSALGDVWNSFDADPG